MPEKAIDMTFDEVLTALSNGHTPTQDSNGWLTPCPLCNGNLRVSKKNKSLSAVLCEGQRCRIIDVLDFYNLKPDDLKNTNGNGHRPKATQPPSPPPGQPPPAQPQVASQAPGKPPKLIIDVSVKELPPLNAQCWQAIQEQDKPPCLFTRNNGIIRVRYDYHDDKAIIEPIDAFILRHELSNFAEWIGKKAKTVDPPIWLVKEVLASRTVPLPRFNRVVTVPVFGPDGSLITVPGYNKASGVIYAPPRGYNSLPLPAKIEQRHIDEAKKLIEEMIQDFPFTCDDAGDSPDHDNAIAFMLLPFVRDMIEAPTPMHLFEASMPGSGKGLLAQTLMYPAFGKVYSSPMSDDEGELRKMLTSAFSESKQYIWFDNVNHVIDSASLNAALTTGKWSDRVLGATMMSEQDIMAIWAICANNATMTGEIARRTIRIRLTPQTDKPEERTGFLHEDLAGWIEENRPRLVWACHVICANAIQQKLPKAKSKVIGSFDRWSRLLGSILECAGYTQFLKNYRVLLEGSDIERQALSLFAMTWHDWSIAQNKNIVTTAELQPIAEGVDGINLRGTTDKAKQTSLGKWLKSKHETVTEYVDDDPSNPVAVYRFKILSMGLGKGSQRGSQTWRIEVLETLDK